MAKKRFKYSGQTWQLIGLAVLAIITAGVVAFAFAGPKAPVAVPASVATYVPPTVAPKRITTVAFFGDSYTAGAGTTQGSKRWTTLLAQKMGWVETNVGRGGTGYLTTAGKEGCGLDVCPNYTGMIAEAAKSNPAIVVVSGGRNDSGKNPAAAADAVRTFFTTLRAQMPNAQIIVTSPVWDATEPPQRLTDLGAVIAEEAATVKATYLDLGQPLGGHPELIAADKVHPTDAGHSALYLATKDAMTRAGVPAK